MAGKPLSQMKDIFSCRHGDAVHMDQEMVKTCDKSAFREPEVPAARTAGELYLEYLEREHKRKEQPGLYAKIQEDYMR
jgi:hypothetical protein